MAVVKNKTCSLWPLVVGLFVTFSLVSSLNAHHSTVDETGSLQEETTEILANLRHAPRIVPRASWMARPAACKVETYEGPADQVVIHHTDTRECYTRADCSPLVKHIQQLHIQEKNWCDISYNFLVGMDGSIYEGRGWGQVKEHTKGHDQRNLGIAFIGNFTEHLPSASQMEAYTRLINVGVSRGKISEDYGLFSHIKPPHGRALVEDVHSWPHFVEELS